MNEKIGVRWFLSSCRFLFTFVYAMSKFWSKVFEKFRNWNLFFPLKLRFSDQATRLKFIYSEKATKFCEIFTVDLTSTT